MPPDDIPFPANRAGVAFPLHAPLADWYYVPPGGAAVRRAALIAHIWGN